MVNLKYASIFGFLAAVAAIIILEYKKSLFGNGPVSISIQALAILLMIWARVTFGQRSFHAVADPTSGELVTTGPYKYFRHPIYAAILYFVWAAIAVHPSLLHFMLGMVVTIGLFIRMVAEEKLVTKQYPEYAAYAAKTKRVIPFIF